MKRDLGFGEVKWLVWGHVLVTAGLGLEYSASENPSSVIFLLESCIKKTCERKSHILRASVQRWSCEWKRHRPWSPLLCSALWPLPGWPCPRWRWTHDCAHTSSGLAELIPCYTCLPCWDRSLLVLTPSLLHWSPGNRLLPWIFSPGKLKSVLFASMLSGGFITLDRSVTESDSNFPLWLLLLQETASWTHFIEHLLHTRHNPELILLSSLSNPDETWVCHVPLENVLCATID